MGYVAPDNSLLMRGALGLGLAARASSNNNLIAGVDVTADEDEDEDETVAQMIAKARKRKFDELSTMQCIENKENTITLSNQINQLSSENTSSSSIVSTTEGGMKTTTVNLTFNLY